MQVFLTSISPKYFWIKAQRDCGIWKYCSKSIYNNKSYFCEVAASMDWLFHGGVNGWEIDDKPFHKTKEEIADQAENFCHRCSWCIKSDPALKEFKQKISEPTLVSISNMKFPKSAKFIKPVQVSPIKGNRERGSENT